MGLADTDGKPFLLVFYVKKGKICNLYVNRPVYYGIQALKK